MAEKNLRGFLRHARNSRPNADMRHADFSGIPLSFGEKHGFMCHVRRWYEGRYRKASAMNAAQKRWLERRKKGKVYSLPRDARLPRKYGRVQVYVDDGERTYAYVGWHPTNGEHAMVRQGKIKLAGCL